MSNVVGRGWLFQRKRKTAHNIPHNKQAQKQLKLSSPLILFRLNSAANCYSTNYALLANLEFRSFDLAYHFCFVSAFFQRGRTWLPRKQKLLITSKHKNN